MIEQQPVVVIDRKDLVEKATAFFKDGFRLVQICCTAGEQLEITYSFDKDYTFSNIRLNVPRTDAVVPSITGSYLAAFPYENELQDLFGMTVTDLAVNFNGKFYIKSQQAPFLNKSEKKTTN